MYICCLGQLIISQVVGDMNLLLTYRAHVQVVPVHNPNDS